MIAIAIPLCIHTYFALFLNINYAPQTTVAAPHIQASREILKGKVIYNNKLHKPFAMPMPLITRRLCLCYCTRVPGWYWSNTNVLMQL